MLMPEAYDRVADDILELYSKLDESIVRDIARRLVKTGEVTATATWQIRQAQESGLLLDDIIRKIAENTDASQVHVQNLFEDAAIEALQWDMDIYEAAGLTPLPLRQSPAAARVLQAGIEKTNGNLQNLTRTTAVAAQRSYISASTLAEMQVESGAFDYVTAIRNAVRSAAADGAAVLYPSGHVDRLDVAVRRSVLTGVGQTTAKISDYYAEDMGCDLVETTAHPGARPEHAEWQGKVFSRSGKHKKYPDFVKSTGYGTGDGLCGWNCRHGFYPFFEGLSASAYPRDKLREYELQTVTFNGQEINYYDATQMQRSQERAIRATKRELVAFEEGMKSDDPKISAAMRKEFNAAAVKLKEQEAALDTFTAETGLYRQREREQSNGFGRSQAQKAVWANKKVNSEAELLYSKKQEEVRSLIRSDETLKTINKGNQNKHIRDSKGYMDGRSFIYGDLETAEKLVMQYNGTGDIYFNRKGEWIKKEFITVENDIGVCIDPETGTGFPTNRFSIHYGKKGTHVVPAERKNKT